MAELDSASIVYGRLLVKHLNEAQEDFDGPERAEIFELIKLYRKQFPQQCDAWESIYRDRTPLDTKNES